MSEKLQEQALRLKFRFDTIRSPITLEELWSLPLSRNERDTNTICLNDIARHYHKLVKTSDDISFVDDKSKTDEMNQMKFDIVKHVIDTRRAEAKVARESALLAQSNAEQLAAVRAIIAQKKTAELASLSIEELTKREAELSK